MAAVLLCGTAYAEEIPVIAIDEYTRLVEADGNFAYCHAPDEDQCTASAYTLLNSNVLSRGLRGGKVTLQNRLVNVSDIERRFMLELANPSLNRVDVEILSGNDTLAAASFGDLTAFSDRVFFHRNYILPFALAPFQEVHVRVTVFPQRESVFLPLRIIEERQFMKSSGLEFLLMGGIAGMYTIYIVFIIGLFLLWRNKLFLYYALSDLFILAYCLFDTGYGFQFLWPDFPFFQRMILPVIAFSYLMALISFTREFFSTQIKYPALDKLMVAFMVVNVISFLVVVILYNIVGTSLGIPLLLLVIIFLAFGITASTLGTVTYLQSGRREGFWYVSLFSIYLVLFFLIINQKGYLPFFIVAPDSPLYYHLPLFTSTPHYIFLIMLVEMLAISAVIAFRFQDVLEEYNVTQRRIENVNRNSIKAFINGQEVERQALAVQLEKQIGVDLNTIEYDLRNMAREGGRDEEIDNSILHLHDVRKDLERIASDFVADWNEVDLTELIDRVFNELKMVLPGVRVIVDIDDRVSGLPVNDLVKLNVYRILQEACNNIIKHAEAFEVQASFDVCNGGLEVVLDDDGVGFESGSIDLRKGIGLKNMETRTKALGGKILIRSTPGVGTRVQLNIPVEQNVMTA
jgi:two-component sensor histidine kinase